MNVLYMAHSGLRYVVLLVGLVSLVLLLLGVVRGRPFGRMHRALSSSYAGLLDLQVLLGLSMVALGRFYPALVGHLAVMLLAAAELHVLLIVNRKRPAPGHLLPLVGVALSLVLVAAGVMAIGRTVFQTTPFVPLP
jgi:hypothetical protein